MGATSSFPEWQSMSSTFVTLFLVILIIFGRSNIVIADEGQGDYANTIELCSADITSILPPPYGVQENTVCRPLWNSFLIRYSQTKDNVVTIVLSTEYTSGWVGIGFSKDGKMRNSSCMIGWITPGGKGEIKQYLAEGVTPSEVKPDKGELPLTSTPLVVLQDDTIYLAFQLKYPRPLRAQPVILAFSTVYPHNLQLTPHYDKTTVKLDFLSGTSSSIPAETNSSSAKTIHGIVGILGWGLFLPCGAMVARYLRHRDPLWYYVHISSQITGFLLGFGSLILGLQLDNRLQANIPTHKGIGILLLVLSILQVFAFFLRPHKESEYRKYWNWYHSWVGRIALTFGALNIVLGMHYAQAGNAWQISYGILLGLMMLTCIVLEALAKRTKLDDPAPPLTF